MWTEVFEQWLLWGAALGGWDVLKRTAEFLDEGVYLSSGTTPQDRDTLIAIALLVRGEPRERCRLTLDGLSAAPSQATRMLAGALRALLESNADELRKNLVAYLYQYKEEEFPKEKVTKKISIEGTFLTHWARHQGVRVDVPLEFEDHIVSLTNR